MERHVKVLNADRLLNVLILDDRADRGREPVRIVLD
jgi:hypothetical protein